MQLHGYCDASFMSERGAKSRGGDFSYLGRPRPHPPNGAIEPHSSILPAKSYTCITRIIDHVVAQGNIIYFGSKFEKTWRIYHDALSTWWSGEAQSYIKQIGFADRQIRLLDPAVAARYGLGMVGNSPELNPLDSHCFADLERMIDHHISLTWHLPCNDIRKFSRGTPAEAAQTTMKLWNILPDSKIIEDIQAIPKALQLIIEAKGCAVDVINNRHGRRAAPRGFKSASGRTVKNMPVPRQSKKTMTCPIIHPIIQDLYDNALDQE